MEGKLNLVIVDGRHSSFKKREKLGAIKDGSSINQLLLSSALDEQALKFVQAHQQGFKFVVLYPTKNSNKSDYYSALRKQHPTLFDSANHTTYIDVKLEDLNKQITQIINSESETHDLQSVSLVSHNLDKFEHGLKEFNFPIFKILFSGYSQDFNKRRQLEEHSYAKNLVSYHVSSLTQVLSAVQFLHKYTDEHKKDPSNKPKIFNVGHYFDYAKMTQMNVYNLLNASYPYKYTPLDFKIPYSGPNPPYGVDSTDNNTVQFLVHKFQDFYKDKSEKAQEMVKKQEQNFADFINRFSDRVFIIDDTSSQDKIRSRIDFNDEMLKILSTQDAKTVLAKYPQIIVSTPKILPFNPQTENLQQFIAQVESTLIFPVLVKAVEASSSKESHFMALVHNIQTLKNFLTNNPVLSKISVVIQEMINHDGRINKLYVIGNHTEMQVRVSIPNIDTEQYKGDENAFWTFDSQKSFKEQLPIKVPDKLDNPNTTLHKGLIWELSQVIRNYFQLNLYGYDIVQRVGTQEYYIVDLNYFPGFKNFIDVVGKFQNLYQDLISKGIQKKI